MSKGRECFAVPRAGMYRFGTVLHSPDAAPDHVAHHRDAAIRRGEVFEAVPGDAAVDADLRVVIARDALAVFVGPARILAETRAAPRLLSLGRTIEADLHRMGVVER